MVYFFSFQLWFSLKQDMMYFWLIITGLICAAQSVSFHLFRRSEPRGIELSNGAVPLNFDRTKPSLVLLHGLGGSYQDNCMSNIANAILETREANVIIPDYSRTAVGYTAVYQIIAKGISSFLLKNGIDASNTMVMGQSMGAQVAGVLNNFGFYPNDIVGLDPAGPQFSVMPSIAKLSQRSARNVQAIHTNVGGLGSSGPDGHLDVFINRGTDFPCCSTRFCRHTGACAWFANTIRSGPVMANACSSQPQARSGTCRGQSILTGFGARSVSGIGTTIAHLSLNQCVPNNNNQSY